MCGQESSKRRPKGAQVKGDNEGHLIGDIMEMLKNISLCLASFTPRFESYVGRTPPSKALTQNTRKVWVQKGTHAKVMLVHALILPMFRVIGSCIMSCIAFGL